MENYIPEARSIMNSLKKIEQYIESGFYHKGKDSREFICIQLERIANALEKNKTTL